MPTRIYIDTLNIVDEFRFVWFAAAGIKDGNKLIKRLFDSELVWDIIDLAINYS